MELLCVSLFERVGELEKELEKTNAARETPNGTGAQRSRSRLSKAP